VAARNTSVAGGSKGSGTRGRGFEAAHRTFPLTPKGMHLKIAIFLIVLYLLAAERIVVHDTIGGLHLT